MVVTLCPAARDTGATHERTASPSRCTVQAPHCAMPHPYFVPVKPSCSRTTQSSGVEGSTSRLTCLPLTESSIMSSLLRHASHCDEASNPFEELDSWFHL